MFDQMPDPTHYAGFDLIIPLTTSGPLSIQTQSDHFNTAGLSVGQHTLYVAADNWNQIGDTNRPTTSCRSPSRSRRRSSRTSWWPSHRRADGGAGRRYQLHLCGQEHRCRPAVGLQQRRLLCRPDAGPQSLPGLQPGRPADRRHHGISERHLQHGRPVGGHPHAVGGGGQLEPGRRRQPGQQLHRGELYRYGAASARISR